MIKLCLTRESDANGPDFSPGQASQSARYMVTDHVSKYALALRREFQRLYKLQFE